MTEPSVFYEVFDLVSKGGIIAVLVIMLVGFYSGKLWPEKHVEKVIEESRGQQAELVAKVEAGIKGAVKDGIVAGIYEVRNSKK